MAKKRICIWGGGLAALSTGIHLLQEGGSEHFDVTLFTMEDRLGGKASSWRLEDGRYMEVGFHAIFGYYHAIQRLLARAGRPITDPRYFTDNEGVHLMYESCANTVNRLQIPDGPLDLAALFHNGFTGYEGMTFGEKLEAAQWLARVGAKLAIDEIPPLLDEHEFISYSVALGLPLELTQKSWFRYVLDLAFNFPSGASAYVGYYGFQRLMGPDNCRVHYFNGPMSEVMIEPITQLYLRLGGKLRFCQKVTDLELDPSSRQLRSFHTQETAQSEPIAGVGGHVRPVPLEGTFPLAEAPYPIADPLPPATGKRQKFSLGQDFDEVVCTLPIDSLRNLFRRTPNVEQAVLAEPELRKLWALRTVASLSLRVWFPQRVTPADYTTVVMATPQPAATLIDYANRVGELQEPYRGSVVEFEGQEGFHANLTDAEITRELLEKFRELPFVDQKGVVIDDILRGTNGFRMNFRRNTADHQRYILMEPGHWKNRYRQGASPYENLTFAGDWMMGSQPTASMEAATRTGIVAANLLRERSGLTAAEE